MKLTRLVQEYGAINSAASVIEETCTELNKLKTAYQDRATELHRVLQQHLVEHLPPPRNICSSERYDAYYDKLRTLANHRTSPVDGPIAKGDRVKIVKAVKKDNFRKDRYYFGTRLDEIPIGSEWSVLQKKKIATSFGGGYSATAYQEGYVLNTKDTLRRNVAFHKKEIQKVVADVEPVNIDEVVQNAVDQSRNIRLEVLEVIRRQSAKVTSVSSRKAIYTIAKTIFPEYKTAIGRIAAEV